MHTLISEIGFKLILVFCCQVLFLCTHVLYDFLLTVKAAPHACVIRTGQP